MGRCALGAGTRGRVAAVPLRDRTVLRRRALRGRVVQAWRRDQDDPDRAAPAAGATRPAARVRSTGGRLAGRKRQLVLGRHRRPGADRRSTRPAHRRPGRPDRQPGATARRGRPPRLGALPRDRERRAPRPGRLRQAVGHHASGSTASASSSSRSSTRPPNRTAATAATSSACRQPRAPHARPSAGHSASTTPTTTSSRQPRDATRFPTCREHLDAPSALPSSPPTEAASRDFDPRRGARR